VGHDVTLVVTDDLRRNRLRVPRGLHEFLARYVRYQVHVYAYVSLAADPYPAFGGAEGDPVDVQIAPPREQGRLGVFFRLLLAIPALVISGVMNC